MKTIRSLNKKNSYKKNIFIKSIELTNKQACLLCKNIENPKPLNKEIIDRFQKSKNLLLRILMDLEFKRFSQNLELGSFDCGEESLNHF